MHANATSEAGSCSRSSCTVAPLQVEMYGGWISVSFLATRKSAHLSMG